MLYGYTVGFYTVVADHLMITAQPPIFPPKIRTTPAKCAGNLFVKLVNKSLDRGYRRMRGSLSVLTNQLTKKGT